MQTGTSFKYNPGVLGDDELVRSFVVRHRCLDLILEALQENASPNNSNRHLLVVGPRGNRQDDARPSGGGGGAF